jgi:hypothetical protein
MEIPFFQKKNEGGEVYCGILLKETQGVCYLFTKSHKGVSVTSQQPFTYSDGWEHIVDDVDEALAILEQGKEQHQRATHCIFFLFSHLIDPVTKEVAKPYIGKMREMVKSLEFKPIGYIEVIDAIHEHLEKIKQTQLSSIVIEIDRHKVGTFLFKGGHKLFSHFVDRTESFAHDVEHALRLKQEQHVFPTQMYLYDSDDLHEESSALLMHNWSKESFIHPPRTTIIQPDELTVALTDLLSKQLCGPMQTPAFEDKEDEQKKEVMGFVIGEDITQRPEPVRSHTPMRPRFVLPSFTLPTLPKLPYIPVLVAIVLLGAICGGVIYFLHRATVVIRIPTQTAKDTVTVTAQVKPSDGETMLSSITASFSASEKKDTTGKKDIGERSGGEVTLYSYEEKEQSIQKGAKLTFNSIQFQTDDSATLPPAQFAADGITKTPGKTKVKVRAVGIGQDGNIEKGKRFTVEGYSANSVFAINDAAFSGGTKKTVRTVAKADIENMRSFISDQAKKNELSKQKNDVSYLIVPDMTKVVIQKEDMSGEVGEEATSISYKATGEVVIFRIPQQAIRSAVQEKLESEKKEGYNTDSVLFSIIKQKETSGKEGVSLTVQGEAVFSKRYSVDDLKSKLVGVSVASGEDVITSAFGLGVEKVDISPQIPILKDRLPFVKNNIQIETLK